MLHNAEYNVGVSSSHNFVSLLEVDEVISTSDDINVRNFGLDFICIANVDDFLFEVLVDDLVDNFEGAGLPVSVFCFLDLGGDEDLLDVDFLLLCCCLVGDALRVILGGSLISISSLLSSPTGSSSSDEPSSSSSSSSDGCSLSSSFSSYSEPSLSCCSTSPSLSLF